MIYDYKYNFTMIKVLKIILNLCVVYRTSLKNTVLNESLAHTLSLAQTHTLSVRQQELETTCIIRVYSITMTLHLLLLAE